MYFLLKMGIFHCYVSLPEGSSKPTVSIICSLTVSYTSSKSLNIDFLLKNDRFHQSTTVDGRNPAPVDMANIC